MEMSSKMQKNPSIRFKGFTDAWEQRKLKEVANHRGGTAIEKYFSKNGKYKVISIGSYGINSKYIDQGIRAVSNDITDVRVVRKGELTMVLNDKTSNGTIIGRSLLIDTDNEYVINQRTEILSPKENFDSSFAYITLNGPFREKVRKIVQGGTQIYVNYPVVENLKLELPDLEEQKKIGTFFKYLDDTIDLHQRQLNDYKQLKKSMLQNMFPQEGETIPKVRFDGFTEEWKQRKLKDAVNGDISDGDWIEKEHIHDEGVYRIIQTGNLGVGTYIDKKDTAKFMNQSSFDTLKANEIYPGDILISRLADPAGRTIVLPESSDRMVTAVDVTVIRPNENFDADFFVAEMNSEKNLNEVAKQVSGTSHKRISRKNLENVEINVTSLAEQKQIGAFFKTLEDTIVLHQQKLSNYQALKSTFLQKMFM